MEGGAEFLPRLEQALDARRAWLDERRGPELLEALRLHLAQLQGLVALLVRKGMIRDNPEVFLQMPVKPGLPPDDPIPENERREVVSWRLLQVRKQLEMFAAGPRLSSVELDAARAKRLASLVAWIPWGNLTEQSGSPTARALAQHVNSIRLGSDRVTAIVGRDAVEQLSATQREIAGIISDFVSYTRECWKLEARRKLLPRLGLNRERLGRPEEVRRAARRFFPVLMQGEAFNADLLDEVLAEDSPQGGEELRTALLARLAKSEERAAAAQREPPHPDRRFLLDSLHVLARAAGEFESAVAILAANAERAGGPTRGFVAFLRRLLLGRQLGPKVLVIDLPTPEGEQPRTERVELEPFLQGCRRKAELLASLAEDGPTYTELAGGDDARMVEFIEGQVAELMVLLGRMAGVNARLQASVAPRRRPEQKGIRLEMAAVKNFAIKAEERKREYTTKVEELRRFQQLAHASPGAPAAEAQSTND